HRHGRAVGRLGNLHKLRQVRTDLPDRRAVREGPRRWRNDQALWLPELSGADAGGAEMTRTRLATVWLDGCSGCHMSFLDIDQRLLEIADQVELVYSPLVDRKDFPDEVDVTLVEGAVSSEEDLEKIRHIRARTRILVSLGDCAVTGDVPSLRH